MSAVIISGMQGSGWQTLSQCLFQAGFDRCEAALDGERAGEKFIEKIAGSATGQNKPLAVEYPSVWQHMNQKFLADHSIGVIVFYARPEYCLAADTSLTSEVWLAQAKSLMVFVHSHRKHCILLDVEQCQNHPEEFIDTVAGFSKITLNFDTVLEKKGDYNANICCLQLEELSKLIFEKSLETAYNDLFVSAMPLADAEYKSIDQRVALITSWLKTVLAGLVDKNGLEETRISLEKVRQDLEKSHQQLEIKESEEELTTLQLYQLQEELETTYQALEKSRQQMDNSRKHREKSRLKMEKKRAEKKAEEASSTLELSRQRQRLKDVEQDLEKARIQIETREDEQELSLLQIHQLQEELEYYYAKYTDLKDSGERIKIKNLPSMMCPAQGLPVLAAKAEITGSHSMADYGDVAVKLFDLILADGRHFPELSFKIVVNSGCAGVEFRRQPGVDEAYLNWPEEMADEYGPYLMIIPNPIEEQAPAQQTLLKSLEGSDYNLVEAALQAVNGLWQRDMVENSHGLDASQLRFWKLAAHECLEQLGQKPGQLRFDQLMLKEQYQAEDYEHLWLEFKNFRYGSLFFANYDFKLQASSLGSGEIFANFVSLSFRSINEGGAPPLVAWPADKVDEYGAELLYHLNFDTKTANLEGCDKLAEGDLRLIKMLIQSLPEILGQVKDLGREDARPLAQWQALVDAAAKIQTQTDSKQLGKLRRIVRKGRHLTRAMLTR